MIQFVQTFIILDISEASFFFPFDKMSAKQNNPKADPKAKPEKAGADPIQGLGSKILMIGKLKTK